MSTPQHYYPMTQYLTFIFHHSGGDGFCCHSECIKFNLKSFLRTQEGDVTTVADRLLRGHQVHDKILLNFKEKSHDGNTVCFIYYWMVRPRHDKLRRLVAQQRGRVFQRSRQRTTLGGVLSRERCDICLLTYWLPVALCGGRGSCPLARTLRNFSTFFFFFFLYNRRDSQWIKGNIKVHRDSAPKKRKKK